MKKILILILLILCGICAYYYLPSDISSEPSDSDIQDTVIPSEETSLNTDIPDNKESDPLITETEEKPSDVSSSSGHYETVMVSAAYDETVPSYDEQVLVKEAWIEEVLISEAYSEEIEYCKEYGYDTYFGYICSGCGYTTESIDEMNAHVEADWNDGCGSYSGQNITYGEAHCLLQDSYTLYHEAVYDYVYHEPEYKTINHPSYVVHHDAVYKKVWVED
ncbi:MAG: hypothetical protein Q4D13_03230 [Erysipelotrichaceae bacterium]|nr:hypothetical protein [Erysipelotrichaceae bacterium]